MFKTLADSTHERHNAPTRVILHSKYFSLCHPSVLSSLHYPAAILSLFCVLFGNNYKLKLYKTVRVSRHSSEEGPQASLGSATPFTQVVTMNTHPCPGSPCHWLSQCRVNPALGALWEAAWEPALQAGGACSAPHPCKCSQNYLWGRQGNLWV